MLSVRVLGARLKAWLALVDGLLVLDADDRVQEINDRGLELLGLESAVVDGRRLTDVLLGAAGLDAALGEARVGCERVEWTGEVPGTGRMVLVRALEFEGELLCSMRDVTGQRAIERQRDTLLSAARADAARTQHLLRLSEVLGATVTVDDVVRAVVRVAEESFASSAAVTLVDRAHGVLRTPRLDHISLGSVARWATVPLAEPGPGTDVVHSRRPLFLDRADLTARWPELDARFRMVAATAVLPLTDATGAVFGLLTLVWPRPHESDPGERELLAAFARYTAQAMAHATVLAERTSEARLLQQAVLTRTLPTETGAELAARYLPAGTDRHAGGDWYDAVRLPAGELMLVIGDVTGHDIAATAAMGQIRTALRALAVTGGTDPAQLLSGLDAVLISLDDPLPTTAVVIVVDTRCGRLRWSNAGHPPPLLVPADGTAHPLAAEAELMLGVAPGTTRSTTEIAIEPGSTLLLYTDGLVEDRVNDLDVGIARLAHEAGLLLADGSHPLGPVLDEVIVRVGAGGGDDVAALAIRFTPT